MLDPQSLRLIGALKYDPGYLLLCDFLQARVDNLTDELANPQLTKEEGEIKLRYWQAFREFVYQMKTEPENFCALSAEERPADETEPILTREVWAKMQNDAWKNTLITPTVP